MLLKCPECELPVSDKAIACPHCGNPMKSAPLKERKKYNRRRRLPNGFGQISEIKGLGLRKPFRAMVTVGKNDKGRPIVKPLKPESYFATYNEAYEALVEYNRNPYDIKPSITMAELYIRWSESYLKEYPSDSYRRTIEAAWAYCSQIYKMSVADVRARHLKGLIDDASKVVDGKKYTASADKKARIKSLLNIMLDYAVEYEVVSMNYARTFTLSNDIMEEKADAYRSHIPFTDVEFQLLQKYAGQIAWTDLVLFQCYSGWRPQELGLLKICDVDLANWTITGGIKTPAGKNRIVPVHSAVRPIVQKYYDEAIALGSEFLFNCTDTTTHRSSLKLTYDKYASRFAKVVEQLKINPDHKPHDGRKHFVTMAKKAGVDEYAIKYMVGHAINDLTEKVYTQRELAWLQNEIEKIR